MTNVVNMVYDLGLGGFRDLDKTNYNDDTKIGIVYLSIKSLQLLKRYFLICGYVLVDGKSRMIYPIDVQAETIAVFEGTYNSFSDAIKAELSQYVINSRPSFLFTPFFIDWQFKMKSDCFTENGPLIKLSSDCLSKAKTIGKMLKYNCHLIEPTNFDELCEFTGKAYKVYGLDIYEEDYSDNFKYLIDSLINGYHINMTKFEIEKVFYQICHLCIAQLEKDYV